jgi:polyphosphate kinase
MKLSPMDLKSNQLWYGCSCARDEMFQVSDTAWVAWFVIRSDDNRQARRSASRRLLDYDSHQIFGHYLVIT